MVRCVIVEHEHVSEKKQELAIRGVPPEISPVVLNYVNRETFAQAIAQAIATLRDGAEQEPKVLIISGHGVPLTGTDIDSDGVRANDIRLWTFDQLFSDLPPNLFIYMSACFGAYPAATALQSDDEHTPYVLGPGVDIRFEHANLFQREFLQLIAAGAGLPSAAELRGLVDKFNANQNLRNMQYGGREFLFVMYEKDGSVYPEGFTGNQLAAPTKPKKIVVVEKLIRRGANNCPVACIVEDESGHRQFATLSALADLKEDHEDLLGIRVAITYQLLAGDHVDGDRRLERIHIVKAKERELHGSRACKKAP